MVTGKASGGQGFGRWKGTEQFQARVVTSKPDRIVLETDGGDPDKVEIDPKRLYIDRTPEDNSKKL